MLPYEKDKVGTLVLWFEEKWLARKEEKRENEGKQTVVSGG